MASQSYSWEMQNQKCLVAKKARKNRTVALESVQSLLQETFLKSEGDILWECIKASEAKNLSYLACHMAGSLAFSQTSSHPCVLTKKQPMFLALVARSIFQNIGFFQVHYLFSNNGSIKLIDGLVLKIWLHFKSHHSQKEDVCNISFSWITKK